jgi:hypothetical protein
VACGRDQGHAGVVHGQAVRREGGAARRMIQLASKIKNAIGFSPIAFFVALRLLALNFYAL